MDFTTNKIPKRSATVEGETSEFVDSAIEDDGSQINISRPLFVEGKKAALLEEVAGVLQPRPDNTVNQFLMSTAPDTLDADGDDYTNEGINIEFLTDHWANVLVTGADLTTPGDPTEQSSAFLPANEADKTIDNNPATQWIANTKLAEWVQVDLGSAQQIDLITLLNTDGVAFPTQIKIIEGSNDNVIFSTLNSATIDFDVSTVIPIQVSNPGSFRYVRVNVDGTFNNQRPRISELTIHSILPATSNNTVDGALVFSGPLDFAPATLRIYDKDDNLIIGVGKVNVDYSVNGAAYTGSLIDFETFKTTISAALFAGANTVSLRLQLVLLETNLRFEMDTTSGAARMSESGELTVEKDGVVTDILTKKVSAIIKPVAEASDYDVQAIDTTSKIDTSGGNVTATLPSPADMEGKQYGFKIIDATNSFILQGEGANLIDGFNTKTFTTLYQFISVGSDGTDYWLTSL